MMSDHSFKVKIESPEKFSLTGAAGRVRWSLTSSRVKLFFLIPGLANQPPGRDGSLPVSVFFFYPAAVKPSGPGHSALIRDSLVQHRPPMIRSFGPGPPYGPGDDDHLGLGLTASLSLAV
eukprot:763371-Hanusia_phi.AAC.2